MSTPLIKDLKDKLDLFLARVETSDEVAEAGDRCGLSRDEAARLLAMYTNEARTGLALIAPLLRPGLRLLEVGCGIGVLARFLIDHGMDVVGIEPGAGGFGFMPALGAAILRLEPSKSDGSWLNMGAEQLDPKALGHFDLIYSTNVLEHIPELDAAFGGMASVLAPGGLMVHLCPNYFVPYEPHYGIPLVPFAPRATKFFYRRTTAKYPGLWPELNFITAQRTRRLARRWGLEVAFDRGVLSHALRRYDHDDVFRERQGGLAKSAYRILAGLGLIDVLEQVPGEYLTPMIMRVSHQGSRKASRPAEPSTAAGRPQ